MSMMPIEPKCRRKQLKAFSQIAKTEQERKR